MPDPAISIFNFIPLSILSNRQLISEGFIPRHSNKESRESIEAKLICYQISPVEEDIIAVEKPVCLAINQELQHITTDIGTKISVACPVPLIEKKEKPDHVYYVWHLQFSIKEIIRHKHKPVNTYTWKLAFPLPLS